MVGERGLEIIHWLTEAIIPQRIGLGEKSQIENQQSLRLEVFKSKISRNTLQEVPFSVLGQEFYGWKLNSYC
jgi:hypothetical protein